MVHAMNVSGMLPQFNKVLAAGPFPRMLALESGWSPVIKVKVHFPEAHCWLTPWYHPAVVTESCGSVTDEIRGHVMR